MMSSKWVLIPSIFNWFLLIQAPVAAFAIYASVYVFGTGTVPSVLAIVATALHFLLGVYCYLTRTRPRSYHLYLVPVWPVVCAGLWCGTLYYVARHVTLANYPESAGMGEEANRDLVSRWAKVGCAMCALSVFVDIVLLGIFFLSVSRQQVLEQEKSSFISTEGSQAPQLPPLTPLDHHRISLPYPQPATNLPEGRPTIIRVPSSRPSSRLSRLSSRLSLRPSSSRPRPQPQLQQPKPTQQPTPWYFPTDPHARPNRINLILSLCHLQQPRGNFPPTALLTTLLQTWTRGRQVHITAHGATALAHACLTDLCHTVWRAQREGREAEVLTWEEMRSLERVGWDLGWVGEEHIRRAGAWLEGVGRYSSSLGLHKPLPELPP